MDDWILSTLNIPSITNELGRNEQYAGQWQVKSKEEAFDIITENSQWLLHLFNKLGAEVKVKPMYYEVTDEPNKVNLVMQVTNNGLSDFANVY